MEVLNDISFTTATYMRAHLGFTRRLLVTSTAKKCEPVAGGPTTPICQGKPPQQLELSYHFPTLCASRVVGMVGPRGDPLQST